MCEFNILRLSGLLFAELLFPKNDSKSVVIQLVSTGNTAQLMADTSTAGHQIYNTRYLMSVALESCPAELAAHAAAVHQQVAGVEPNPGALWVCEFIHSPSFIIRLKDWLQ